MGREVALRPLDGGRSTLAETIRNLDAGELSEALAELEHFFLEDIGWRRIRMETEWEFSNIGLMEIIRFSRFMFLKNPLINSAVTKKADYVWGQGATFSGQGTVGEVVEAVLQDPKNLVSMTSHQMQWYNDIQVSVDANLFVSMFTNPSTGRVIFRIIPVEEILEGGEIISNPNDRYEPWYYKRKWVEHQFDVQTGKITDTPRTAYYPDWRYQPDFKPPTIGEDNAPVFWDAPVYHIKVGGLGSMRFGVPENYSALDWARAVKDDMEAYMAMRKALMRYAWILTVKGGKKGVSAARQRLNSTATFDDPRETNPAAGSASTFIRAQEMAVDLQPLRTSGSAPSPDEGRRVGLMVAAGTGLPETMLFGDASTGNLATAETLDRPTELMMANRQQLWADAYRDILGYAVRANILAPNGRLQGSLQTDEFGRTQIELSETDDNGNPVSAEVSAYFPPILKRNVGQQILAIVDAATLMGRTPAGTMTDRLMVQLLLQALNDPSIDVQTILEDLFPDGATMLPSNPEVIAGDAGAQPGEANFTRRETEGLPEGQGPGGQIDEELQLSEALTEFRSAVHQALMRSGFVSQANPNEAS